MRIALLATDATNIYSCPHVCSLDPTHQPGDLFLVTDHANLSASSPGLGPNLSDYGPRFYDITHMYHDTLT